ncbi:SAGA-associated factor 29 homolog A isoform X6 [Pistacia vera]|uniref:SAGA-associated factor 29 homolog A isoform X5 n=1 Tax=Pistacia vera TaxID=55513 RepID=UPI001262F54D|nr:SAGA-associated factor 29 homolog A isoform X5 [Pistacia vera]XP_031260139.1 SAGA-associated factor 29 homolog A isoform X6 [Pistacia vera]
MSSPDVVDILDRSKELDRLRKEQEEVLIEINKMHKKLQATPELVEKPGDNSLAKLKGLYIQAKDLSENEVAVSNMLLNQLDAFLPPGPPGQQRRRIGNDQKRKRMKNDSDISRPSHVRSQLEACASLKNEQVAARVTDGDKDEWFVVKVMHFDRDTREFEVLDEEPGDDEEGGVQRKYKLPMSCIIPFPKRNDPSSVPEFAPGRHVLAVYPGTTALYKATVVNTPRKRKSDDYLLEFDDDEEDGALPQRTVPFHRVVAWPEDRH